MSYRAFKRLLGETSLERKCRFLFGAFILVLISSSFWLYAWQTEDLANAQIPIMSRLLVGQIVAEQVATRCHPKAAGTASEQSRATTAALAQFAQQRKELWPELYKEYRKQIIKPVANRSEDMPDHETLERLREFEADPSKQEANELLPGRRVNFYYGAVRASKSCLECHAKGNAELVENGLLAVVKIEMPTQPVAVKFHTNQAVLLCIALGTALLIMGGSYLIVRYVIVKPVKHLKEVSDAISAGELNVRSEIQTGDEFEDLSHAFNRMLRNLVSMQDRLRKVNADLDRKVDELAQANLALYESNRLKADFLATMSHELRTPLNSILGFSEVLQSSNTLSEKQMRWVQNIRTSGEQLLALINDILDLAKIEAGKMQVRVAEFSACDVCEGLLAMFRPLAEKKNIDLRSQLEAGLPLVRQDMVKLQQIVSNLLSNAIKFTPEGGRVLLKVEATAGPNNGHLVITVSDTGVGIALEEQELVFEKFRQAGNPLTRQHAGTGLGLSIVRELSKLLGGEVTLQSELGRGSTFTVRLPVQLSEEPRLEFDLAHEGIDLSKAQRVDVRLYAGHQPLGMAVVSAAPTRLDLGETRMDPAPPAEEMPPAGSEGPTETQPGIHLTLPSLAQSLSSCRRLTGVRSLRQEDVFMQEAGSETGGPTTRRTARILPCLVVGGLALIQGGCLVIAAGAAASAAATGYVFYKGRVCRDYPAGLADAQAGTRTALLDLQFPVVTEETKNGTAYLASKTADGTPVRIWLEMVPSRVPADGLMTRISIRVGAFGDEVVSARILDQVGLHLVVPGLARPLPAVPSAVAPAAIQPVRALVPGETAAPPLASSAPKK